MTGHEDAASRTYMVQMPLAEARHLAGTSHGWPAASEARLAAVLREWLARLSWRRGGMIPVRRVVTDLSHILETVPLPQRPVRDPFGPGCAGLPLPGHVEHLGGGVVRLDDTALTSLAGLHDGEDFKVTFTDAGPVLSAGPDHYVARMEEPNAKPGSPPTSGLLPPA